MKNLFLLIFFFFTLISKSQNIANSSSNSTDYLTNQYSVVSEIIDKSVAITLSANAGNVFYNNLVFNNTTGVSTNNITPWALNNMAEYFNPNLNLARASKVSKKVKDKKLKESSNANKQVVNPQIPNMGILSLSPNYGTRGEVMQVYITGINEPFLTTTAEVKLVHQDGSQIGFINPLFILSPNLLSSNLNIPNSASYGFYDFIFDVLDYPSLLASLPNAFYVGPSNSVSGKVYVDYNNNGAFDAGVDFLAKGYIVSGGNRAALTDNNGNYQLYYPEGNVTVSPTDIQEPGVSVFPQSNNYTFTSTIVQLNNQDFRIFPQTEYHNLSISIYPSISARHNDLINFVVMVKNLGFHTENATVTVTNQTPEFCSFSGSNITPASINGNSQTFHLDNFEPFEQRFLFVGYLVNGFANDVLTLNCSVQSQFTDDFPENNTSEASSTVISSYDPNIKEVYPSVLDTGFVTRGEYLNYTIHFQNTGNDTAFNIRVFDQLSDFLDISTFEFIGATHNCLPKFYENGLLVFYFNDILLPDSTTNEPESHGILSFKIKPKANFMLGDVINNTAEIYFDYNEAVITNTTSSEMTLNSAIEIMPHASTVHPNPTKDRFTINFENSVTSPNVSIINILGKEQKNFSVLYSSKNKVQLDICNLANGIYFVKIESNLYNQVVKVIKE